MPQYYLVALSVLLLPRDWHHYMPLTLPLSVFLAERLYRDTQSPAARWGSLAGLAFIVFFLHMPQYWLLVVQNHLDALAGGAGFGVSWFRESVLRLLYQRFFLGTVALLMMGTIFFVRLTKSQDDVIPS
jgi:hypothetical protein